MDKEKVLSLLLLLLFAGSASAGSNDTAKIALHLQAVPTGKAPSVCDRAPLPPCTAGDSSLAVVGDLNTPYDLYVLVLDGSALAGVGGAAFGIEYGPGVVVSGWTLCADLDFSGAPQGSQWPDSGSGNLITWNVTTNCQNTPAEGDLDYGVTAVLGALHVYSYAAETISITPRNYAPTPDFSVTDCTPERSDPPYPDNAGRVTFGQISQAYDPCSPPDSVGPSAITTLGVDEETAASLIQTISWVATGDDGDVGTAAFYDIRYSEIPLDGPSWAKATRLHNAPPPLPAGASQHLQLDLPPDREYNVAIKAYDELGNSSPLSNFVRVEVPADKDFELTIAPEHLLLWLAGTPIDGTSDYTVRYSNEIFSVNDVDLNLRPQQTSSSEEDSPDVTVKGAPFIEQAVNAGLSPDLGVAIYYSLRSQLVAIARQRYLRFGPEAGLLTLQRSPLVASVERESHGVRIVYKNKYTDRWDVHLSLETTPASSGQHSITYSSVASKLAEKIETWAAASHRAPVIMFVSPNGSGLTTIYGEEAKVADMQARHLLSGGSLESLPPGPLSTRDGPLVDILRKTQGQRQ